MVDGGERNTIARLHAIYYRDLEIDSLACAKGDRTAERWRHVRNARAALEWSFSEQGDKEIGTALAAALAPLFLELSILNECRFWMERAIGELNVRGDRREMVLQEALAISLMLIRGDGEEVYALAKALSFVEALELPYHRMRLLAAQHTFLMRTGDFRGAAAVAEQNKAVAKRAADPMAMMMADWRLGISHHLPRHQPMARPGLGTGPELEP